MKEKRIGIEGLWRKDVAWVLRRINKKQAQQRKRRNRRWWEQKFKDQALPSEHHTSSKEKSRAKHIFCLPLLPTHFVSLQLLLGRGEGNGALLLWMFLFNLVWFYFSLGVGWGLGFFSAFLFSSCPFSFQYQQDSACFSGIKHLLIQFCWLHSVPY